MKYDICNRIKYSHKSIYSADLEREFKIAGATLRDIIRELRREGFPIANSSKGYFYANNHEEIKPTLDDLRGRAMSMLETANKIESNFKETEQLNIF